MNRAAISHRCAFSDCYALNDKELIINLRTGKEVTAVTLIHDDPYAGGCTGHKPWQGRPQAMVRAFRLKDNDIWSLRVTPPFKREQYYFSITDGKQTLYLFEDGLYCPEEAEKPGRLKQYFKFPWLNSADVVSPPTWVNETVWYQIMPDRFCRGDLSPKRVPTRDWSKEKNIHFWDTYGGDIPGIISKLEYIAGLGITGIYMTPLFLSNSNHKYNTFDYDRIDPDFGTEADMARLVEKAHSLGIRVMLDAVFNHSGTEFAPWKDVVEKGPASRYWGWFFVNRWPLPKLPGKTEDGRFYTFAFTSMMPKLNTNNPEVIDYFLRRCQGWIQRWNIDGIRFDVGNEVSHKFLKTLNRELKAMKPDIFLLGEIWHDSGPWLLGDEYDSVMNFPFLQSLHNFWLDGLSTEGLMQAMDRCFSMYQRQTTEVLFNFIDNHDTMRALTRCGSRDVFFQQLAVLMTMPGSACIYYGTEIALPGGDDPDNRRPMPWDRVENGTYQRTLADTRRLIELRKAYPQARQGLIRWHPDPENPRLVCYTRVLEGLSQGLTVYLNAGESPRRLAPKGKLLFSRKLRGRTLMPGGVAIVLEEDVWG